MNVDGDQWRCSTGRSHRTQQLPYHDTFDASADELDTIRCYTASPSENDKSFQPSLVIPTTLLVDDCLSVCLCARYLKEFKTDFDETWHFSRYCSSLEAINMENSTVGDVAEEPLNLARKHSRTNRRF